MPQYPNDDRSPTCSGFFPHKGVNGFVVFLIKHSNGSLKVLLFGMPTLIIPNCGGRDYLVNNLIYDNISQTKNRKSKIKCEIKYNFFILSIKFIIFDIIIKL